MVTKLFLVIILSVAIVLVGCATPNVTITIEPDGATIKGNTAGREITYNKTVDGAVTTVTVSVKDERNPNPIVAAWTVLKDFLQGIFGKADMALNV